MIKTILSTIASFFVGTALLSSCEAPANKVVGDRAAAVEGANLYVPAFRWSIRSASEVSRIRQQDVGDGHTAYGFVGTDKDTHEIVIYTTQPKRVNDEVACSLGHEIMHLPLGNYHR